MTTRTKIICTIGPACNTVEKMIALMEAGMNVARLNFSHGTHDAHLSSINNLKEARKRSNKPLAILLDTKGPEIRVGKVEGDGLSLTAGQHLLLVKEEVMGTKDGVTVVPSIIFESVHEGMTVLFDNGFISSRIVKVVQDGFIVEIDNPGILKSNKGVNIPNKAVDLPAMTEKDIEDICFGCRHDIDLIAASFVRSAENVLEIKRLLIKEGKPDILVFAKIESFQGVENFDAIVQVADGIMIARGDLGVELPVYQVPRLQKMMIRKSCLAGKPIVTATQMLESMMNNPRPTRADVSDIANAIYDSTSCVMLSGETAVGLYPVETVRVMKSVIQEAEGDFNYREFFYHDVKRVYHDIASSVTLASVKTAYSAGAKAIFTFTSSGRTARLISRLRPEKPIIAMTPSEKIYNQLSFNWGVVPFLCKDATTFEAAFAKISQFALEMGLVNYGDLVVVTAGNPFGVSGTTNMMLVESIGDVVVRGSKGSGSVISGKVAIVLAPDSRLEKNTKGCLVVVTRCNDSYIPIIKNALGIILQNHVDDVDSERYVMAIAKSLGIPVIVQADAACHVLKDGQVITIDPQKGLVYKGVVEGLG
ncbi:MAG: pyruvate kinase [Chlamydiales bacterium]|nr:pyruvate kinase [Chlamydiales bacterium]